MNGNGMHNGGHGFCHTCTYNGKRDPACLSCKGFSELGTKGKNIHFEAYDDEELAEKKLKPAADYRPGAPSRELQLVGVTDNARDCMLALLAEVSMLADEDAPLMVKLIGGMSQDCICTELRITSDELRRMWIAARDKYPICAAYVRRINANIDSEPVKEQPTSETETCDLPTVGATSASVPSVGDFATGEKIMDEHENPEQTTNKAPALAYNAEWDAAHTAQWENAIKAFRSAAKDFVGDDETISAGLAAACEVLASPLPSTETGGEA